MTQSISCDSQNSVLFRKYPLKEFDAKTKIIVPDTHNAIIVKDGIALETLTSGKYYLFDKKKGILKDIQNIDDIEIFIIFVSKTAKLNILWGTETKYDMRDPITGAAIQLGASGEFEVQISNPRKAYLELIGLEDHFDTDMLKNRLQGRLLAEIQYRIANAMNEKKLSYDRLGEILLPMSNEILPHISKMFEEDYGLRIFSFTISRVVLEGESAKKLEEVRSERRKEKIKKEEKLDEERLDDKKFQRQLDLARLEHEDYAKYLEVCKLVGFPQTKKDTTAGTECPNCGVKITKDTKFCPVCGTEIKISKIKCPFCGKVITKDDMFCKHCGGKVKE